MKLKSNFQPCSIGDASFLIPIGNAVIDVSSLLDLNEVGAFIVDQIKDRDCSREELIDLIDREFDSDKETIRADVDRFLKKAKRIGFIEE